MKKMTWFIWGILALILVVMFIGISMNKKKNKEIEKLEQEILRDIEQRDSIKDAVRVLESTLKKKELSEIQTERVIDSLQVLIDGSKDEPCEHRLILYKEQNGELKTALNKCKEVKVIQTKIITNYKGLVINHEIICPKEIKVAVQKEKQKGRAWKWIAGAGWTLFLIVLI